MVDPVTGLLTVKDVASELGRSIEQVRRYIREGRLPARKIGLQWFVAPEQLHSFRSGAGQTGTQHTLIERIRDLNARITAESGGINVVAMLDESRRSHP